MREAAVSYVAGSQFAGVVVVVVGGSGADDNTRVPFSAVNRRELAARTLSCNIYCVRTSPRLHKAPASSVSRRLLDLLTSLIEHRTRTAAFFPFSLFHGAIKLCFQAR